MKRMTSETASEHWYALKVFYNKVFEIEAYLKDKAFESYIPLKTGEMMWRGEKKICRKPAVSSLMFVRATEHAAIGLQRQLNNRIIVYCDRDTKRPAAIPEREMNIFRLVTSSGDRELEYFGGEDTVYHTGDRVRVTEGIFKGAEGYIRRIFYTMSVYFLAAKVRKTRWTLAGALVSTAAGIAASVFLARLMS